MSLVKMSNEVPVTIRCCGAEQVAWVDWRTCKRTGQSTQVTRSSAERP
jgi:hypothetical protein